MMTNNFAMYGMKILAEIGRDFLYFPLWWYSRGLIMMALSVREFISNRQRSLALFVWVRNIFKPMYGQYDWQGALISFFMRLVQIIFRSLVMLLWIILGIVFLLIWLALPIFVIYEIIFQFI